jgi:pyrroloquinoline quinone biosynthesis protein E
MMGVLAPDHEHLARFDRAERIGALRALPQPEPVPNLQAYLDERRSNYERYLAASRRSADVDYLPVKLDIENVSRCNFRCTMCVVSDWHKGQRADDMCLTDFKRLLDEQYGLVEIKLQGIGEPLMQREDFFEMIRYAREQSIWVRTTTNASLLHLSDNYRRLIDTGVNEVQISIDGASKEVFERIRRGSVFDRVVANCKLINAYCEERGVVRCKMWTVVQKDNRHELLDRVTLAKDMGFRTMVFALNLSDWAQQDWAERNQTVSVEEEFDPDFGRELVRCGEELGITVRFWVNQEKYSTASPERLCPWPFERAYVASDMRVVPCCHIGNPDVHQIGDPLDGGTGFSGVWTSEAYSAFRQSHLEGKIPDVCRSCYFGNGRAADTSGE